MDATVLQFRARGAGPRPVGTPDTKPDTRKHLDRIYADFGWQRRDLDLAVPCEATGCRAHRAWEPCTVLHKGRVRRMKGLHPSRRDAARRQRETEAAASHG
ncbi:MAG: hypothetical protein ACRDRO_04095 [Pseudonocardiaceae bacterium]